MTKHWPVWPLIVATFALVLLPPTIGGFPREIARWHLAIANDRLTDAAASFYSGQAEQDPEQLDKWVQLRKDAMEDADAALEKAAKWAGKTADYFAIRASYHQHEGDIEKEIDSIAMAVRKSPQKWFYLLRLADAENRRKNFATAEHYGTLALQVADNANLYGPRANILNSLAYARGLAGINLEEALKNIDEAIEIHESMTANLSEAEDIALLMYRDTRGFVLYRLGRNEDAKEQFDKIWVHFDEQMKLQFNQVDLLSKSRVDLRTIPGLRLSTKQSFAVIMYHRMLVLDGKKDSDMINTLRRRVLGLGHQPNPNLF
jgi:tetratricopeptide (TPR) repeat protein